MSKTKEMPCMKAGLNIEVVGDKIAVFQSEQKKNYLLGQAEYNVLIHLDGVNSLEKLSEYSGKYNTEQIKILIEKFKKLGFIQGEEPEKEKGIFRRRKLGIVNGNRHIKSDSLLTKLLYFILVYLSIPVLCVGLWKYYAATNGFEGVNLQKILHVNIFMHFISFLIIATLHEISHAVIARKNQVSVPEIGLMIYFFMPYVYTNMSYIRLLKSKWKRILCLLGGIMLNVLLSGIFFLIAGFVPEGRRIVLEEIAFMNLLLIISNLLIFFKLDGYFILQEMIGENYLREKSIQTVVRTLQTGVRYIARADRKNKCYVRSEVTDGKNTLFYFLFGVLNIVYVPVMLILFLLNWI